MSDKENKSVDLSLHPNNAEASFREARLARWENFKSSAPSVFKIIFCVLLFLAVFGYAFSVDLPEEHRLDFLDTFNTEWLLNTLGSFKTVDFFWFQKIPKINFSTWVVSFGSLGSISFEWLKYPFTFLFNYVVKPLLFLLTGIYQVSEFIFGIFDNIVPYLQGIGG